MISMKVAVTGASGFIGQHVLNALLNQPVEIIAITRHADKLAEYKDSTNIVQLDIAEHDADVYKKIGSPDVLIHLAWDGLPNYKSLHHFENELPKQYRFLKSMITAGLPALVATGTCFEYGMQSGALSETMPPDPANPYGYAKDALRRQLEFLKAHHTFNFVWTRLFYMFGEGQSESSLYPKLKATMSNGEGIFNMSGGEQLRDYLAVQEVASRIVMFALSKHDCGVVNLCSGNPVSVKALVQDWIKANDWNIRMNLGYYPYPDYEPMDFWGDPTKQNELLGMK